MNTRHDKSAIGVSPGVKRLLADLTDPQRQAVTHTDGPLLVLAGAGSGKTRVLTRRVAYLALTVTMPRHILAITFTNKAANEMKERVVALNVAPEATVCTFHSLCARLLRIHHERADLSPNFTIFDQTDRRKLIKQAIEQAGVSESHFAPGMVEGRISRAKNAMRSPGDFEEAGLSFTDRTVARIYEAYEAILTEQNGLDFDDLLLRMANVLQRDEELRGRLEDQFRYVLVDEYQDTNRAQYLIAHHLTRDRRNLFVTGDPDQSIYGWRGADINNILSFEEDHPQARVVFLEQNYRSTKRILSAADRLISGNELRKAKGLWTENAEGCPVRLVCAEDGEAEADAIVEDISRQVAQGRPLREFAVFYRVNALSRLLEAGLRKGGVAYVVARGLAFYARKEIKDVLAYLRVLVNPADAVSLERIINTPPRGIGQTTIDRLKDHAATTGVPLFDVVRNAGQVASLKRATGRVADFVRLLDELSPLVEEPPRMALEQTLSRTGLRAALEENRDSQAEAVRNVDELISAAAEFERNHPDATLLDWLSFTSLIGDEDVMEGESGAVTLMTLHAAKGLEFPVVYIMGVEHGLLPLERGPEGVEDLEEERRLCFVGMTRAKERLTLTHARWRMLRGVTRKTTRSQFLDELPKDEIESLTGDAAPSDRRQRKPTGALPDDAHLWEVGTFVRHPREGIGVITNLQRGRRRTHVAVQFQDGHRGNWVLEFADLERVDADEIG